MSLIRVAYLTLQVGPLVLMLGVERAAKRR